MKNIIFEDAMYVANVIELGLFDKIPFKWTKNILTEFKEDDYAVIEMIIEDLPMKKAYLCRHNFKFTLFIKDEYEEKQKEFNIKQTYNTSSIFALILSQELESYNERIEYLEQETREEEQTIFSICCETLLIKNTPIPEDIENLIKEYI